MIELAELWKASCDKCGDEYDCVVVGRNKLITIITGKGWQVKGWIVDDTSVTCPECVTLRP